MFFWSSLFFLMFILKATPQLVTFITVSIKHVFYNRSFLFLKKKKIVISDNFTWFNCLRIWFWWKFTTRLEIQIVIFEHMFLKFGIFDEWDGISAAVSFKLLCIYISCTVGFRVFLKKLIMFWTDKYIIFSNYKTF